MDNKKIGLFLKDLRLKQGLSQKGIAPIASVSHQAVSKWEKGESIPDLSSLLCLSNYYKITINEILEAEIDSSNKSYKPYNNQNKEIIKVTISLFILLVSFLPFYKDSSNVVYDGFHLLGDVEFGLGIMTYITMLGYIAFQIVFSLFTIFRIISFSRGNILLNRGITVIMLVLIWFTLALSELYPYPYIAYFVYLASMYIISTRVLRVMDMKIEYGRKTMPKYQPYVYIGMYIGLLIAVPIYLIFFNAWYRELRMDLNIVVIILLIVSVITFIFGYIKRQINFKLASILKHITVTSMRLAYVIIFYLSYTESLFFSYSNSNYNGIMVVIIYIAFELLISSKYSQAVKQIEDSVPLFK